MSARLEWHGEEARRLVRRAALAQVTRVCIAVKRKAKELLSVPGTGKVKGKRVGAVTRSAPGEPPRKQTGNLRASVTHEIDESTLTGRVGTNVVYGKHLELGTKRGILPRPWLRPAAEHGRTVPPIPPA